MPRLLSPHVPHAEQRAREEHCREYGENRPEERMRRPRLTSCCVCRPFTDVLSSECIRERAERATSVRGPMPGSTFDPGAYPDDGAGRGRVDDE